MIRRTKLVACARAGAALLALLALVGCAARAARQAAGGGDAAAAADVEPQPPDGRWLVDERGREYFLDSVPRTQAARLGPDDVRTFWGIKLEVVREDAERYWFKVYRPAGQPLPVPLEEEGVATGEELRAIRERYRASLRETDRLELAGFGEGLPDAGQWRESFAIADVNADGWPDIVHGPARKSLGPPVVFLGDGAGRWRRWREAAWPPLPYDYGAAAVADLNADGAPDLVLGVHLGGVLVLAGDGRGGFAEWGAGVDFARAGAAFSTRAVAVLDADRDGAPDIVALGEGPRLGPRDAAAPPSQGLLVYRNRGGGKWERDARSAGAGRTFGSAIAAGDFDGDGIADLATGSGAADRREIVSLGRPDGTFAPAAVASLRPSAVVGSVAAADFDRDGADDLAVATVSLEGGLWRAAVDVVLSPASSRERRVTLWSAEDAEDGGAVGAGDLDGDGAVDVVLATERGDLLLFPGDGAGGFTRERAAVTAFGGGCRASHVALADLDGDGRAEVVASFALEDAGSLGGGEERRCPSGGGIGAWKARRR